MAKQKTLARRSPPKRRLSKQQAIRHLLHSACRMIIAREDPFAIHLLLQSVDKLLIDLAKKTNKKLVFRWDEFIKPAYRKAFIETIRETSNFLKHADKDHDSTLYVGRIAALNLMEAGLCIVNYHGLFGEWTDHMRAIFTAAKFLSSDGFVAPEQRVVFDALLPKVQDMTLGQYLSNINDPVIMKAAFPNLLAERIEDLQDTVSLYGSRIRDLGKD